ncbi:MAG TPA: hypothetical protein ENI79_01180 [Rhodospirillales bacterium]|mgnify:CR=1 FL=1|nr:hypothetical protein [Rhodospirillales bacterium]
MRYIIAVSVFLLTGVPTAWAQKAVPAIAPAITPLAAGAAVIDLREQMRKFVQSVSAYARKLNPNFIVIPENGLELLVKRDVTNPERTAPAQAYMRAIDGVLVVGLFFPRGKPLGKDKQKARLKRAEQAKAAGLKVLVVEYAKKAKKIDEAHRLNAALGFTPFAAPKPMDRLNAIPPYPARPFAENPNSILSLGDARNFLVLADSSAFGRQDEFTMKMHAHNYDALIVDVFHGREALSKRAVETLKYKKIGGRRLVLARIDIGSAASYRYYWKDHWREGSPLWITAPHRDNPDKHRVQYWRQEWRQVISGGAQSYIYGVIAQGFDGVVLQGVDAFRFFENPEIEEEDAP